MKIAIIGTGNVGSALGKGWAKAGHEIIFGTRNAQADKVKQLVSACGPKAKAVPIGLAVREGELIVLAVPWRVAQDVVTSFESLLGKVLIDCTNPLRENLMGLIVGHTTSAAETIALLLRGGACVVKAFNTTGAENMMNPTFGKDRVTMFYCGDDAPAKETVKKLIEDLGFEPFDTGALYTARFLENLAALWVHQAYVQKMGTNFAFKILRR